MEAEAKQELPERLRGVREEREGEGEEVGRGETQNDQNKQPNLLWYEANA